jgi:hypothetical protein
LVEQGDVVGMAVVESKVAVNGHHQVCIGRRQRRMKRKVRKQDLFGYVWICVYLALLD